MVLMRGDIAYNLLVVLFCQLLFVQLIYVSIVFITGTLGTWAEM